MKNVHILNSYEKVIYFPSKEYAGYSFAAMHRAAYQSFSLCLSLSLPLSFPHSLPLRQ